MLHTFVSTLFGSKPDNHHVLVWELSTKRSAWFKDITLIPPYIQAHNKDVYIGCGTSLQNFGERARCPSEQIAGIGGLWLDIDIKGRGHKKENLPATEEDVQAILATFPLEPTIVINSGNGRQCWWTFSKFWSFKNNTDREDAAMLVHCFTTLFRNEAFKLGFGVDMTHDLARIFRLPDTYNAKEFPHLEVKMMRNSGIGYTPEDIVRLIPKETVEFVRTERTKLKTINTASAHIIGKDFTIRPDADPPWEMLSVLCINDPVFEDTWNKRRRDLKDDSPSGYDMALASIACRNGWTKQEVVDLLIAFRRKHNLPPKAHRGDYYQATLAKAHSDGQQFIARDTLEKAVVGTADMLAMPADDRKKKLLEALSTALNVSILRILKYDMDPPEYRLVTNKGSIHLGRVKGLTTQSAFRNAIADATGIWFQSMKPKDWDNAVQIMLNICELVDTGEEATEKGLMKQWLYGYLTEKAPQITTDVDHACLGLIPFTKDTRLFFFGVPLREWIMICHKETVSLKELGKKLRLIDCEPEKVAFKIEGKPAGRSAWSIKAHLPMIQSLLKKAPAGKAGGSSDDEDGYGYESEPETAHDKEMQEEASQQEAKGGSRILTEKDIVEMGTGRQCPF